MVARSSILLVVALVVALLPAGSSGASSYSTTVVVSLKTPAFHGSVKSSRSSCVTSRTVKLLRKKPGPDTLLGTDTSNGDGKWSIPLGKRLSRGSYYAKAPAKGACKPDKSRVLTI